MGENNGKCLCGDVTFQVTGEPVMQGNCHCTDCKKNTGAAFATILFFKDEQVSFLSGETSSFHYTADSGNKKTIENSKNDNEISSADIVDQAASVAERSVELRTVNRQIKLISKIDKALDRIKNKTYGFCEDTGEPIGLKRLIARPIAILSIEAQERHENKEKIFADN